MTGQHWQTIADREAAIRHYADCIRKGDDPETVLRVALSSIERPVPIADEDNQDPEEFCARCYAGVDSGEHHEKCVVTGHAEDGESASEPAPQPLTREQIAEALYLDDADHEDDSWAQASTLQRDAYLENADAVLALLQKGGE